MAQVSIIDNVTGNVIARKRSSEEMCARFALQYDPAKYRVSKDWLEVTRENAPTLRSVRRERDRLLAAYEWTVSNASPLTVDNQKLWKRYLRQLHKVTKDLSDPAAAVWPAVPGMVYDDAE